MRLSRLWLKDFRSYTDAELELSPGGLTVVMGDNGQGKTNLLEAVGYLARLESFRGVQREALVRRGCERGFVRASGLHERREILVEAEISLSGRDRTMVNRQPLRRARDLLGVLRVTMFSPDDLDLVKGGPAGRRRFLDEILVSMSPRYDAVRADLDRVLRQRATLLRQAGGRLTPEVSDTLAVWDEKLCDLGEGLVAGREGLVSSISQVVTSSYSTLAGAREQVELTYSRSWEGSLGEALVRSRPDDLRRGITTVGPHRDELELTIAGLPARTHASQGEQRSLALALRLGSHFRVKDELRSAPVLLLDDVLSELDPSRERALINLLPPGQALLTTAGALPGGLEPDSVVRLVDGRVKA